MKKKIIWGIIILAIIGGGYFLLKPKAPTTVYTTADVTRGDLKQTVSETGTIQTVNQTDLVFKVSGRVVGLFADVGDPIKVGQLLARLDQGSLSAQLEQTRENVQAEKKTLASMINNPSQFNGNDKKAEKHKIESLEAEVEAVKSQIRDTYMYSPINGVILKRNVDPFESTVADSPTPVFTIGDPSDMEIDVDVPESDITKIKLGQMADITFDALPADQIFEAKVIEIDPDSTVVQDVVNYRIKLKLTNNDERIKSGMSTNIDVHTAQADNVLIIPLRAVTTENNQQFVQILNADGKTTTKVQVKTGLQGDEGMVEVKSGLSEGQKVVTFTQTQ